MSSATMTGLDQTLADNRGWGFRHIGLDAPGDGVDLA